MDDATTTPNAQNSGATDPSATKAPLKVTSAELVRNFSELSDQALTEPIIITKNGRERLVLLAIEDYQRLKKRERRVWRAGEVPDDIMALIEKVEMDPKYDYLNEDLGDWQP
jgi:prevent-host-death family protein